MCDPIVRWLFFSSLCEAIGSKFDVINEVHMTAIEGEDILHWYSFLFHLWMHIISICDLIEKIDYVFESKFPFCGKLV